MINLISNIYAIAVNIISNIGDTLFWWHILLIALAGVVLVGLVIMLILAISLKRKRLKKEKDRVKYGGHVHWSD